jgi:nicotinamidase-related amidase
MGLDNSYHAAVVEPNKRILAAARAAKTPIVFTRYSVNAD